jgi:trimethylamine--corrinoid protein Co-methyltransferase
VRWTGTSPHVVSAWRGAAPSLCETGLVRPSLRVLDDDLLARIVAEAKRVLAEIGVEVRGAALRTRLLETGLRTDARGERLLFPAEVVEDAIASAPSTFTLYDRAGRPHAELGHGRAHFVPGSSGLRMIDHHTGEARHATTADFVDFVRLADGLPNIAYLATAFSTDDVPAQISDAWRLALCLLGSERPVVSGAFSEHGVPRMVELMQLFRRDRDELAAKPLSIFTITATGSFRYGEDSCQNLLDCVEAGIPIEIVPVTLMGLIAPVTLVGATVFHTADVLAGITMAQLVRPGAPVLFGGAPAAFHMKAASSPMAAVEALHLDVAYAQVGRSLGLPTQAYMALSDSYALDAQAGAETFGSAILAALAGVDSVSGPGMLAYVLAFSLSKLVLDDELCGQALHLARPIEPKGDVPVIDLVRSLLAEQHLITHPHTIEHWPSELWVTGPTIDRENRESWDLSRTPDLSARAAAEVDRRLTAYRTPAIDPAAAAELVAIVQAGDPDATLPEIPPAPEGELAVEGPQRRRNRRRG